MLQQFLSLRSVFHSVGLYLITSPQGNEGKMCTKIPVTSEAGKYQLLIGFCRGFWDHFRLPDIFFSLSFVVSFIVRNLVGLNVWSKKERHSYTWPLCPVSHQRLLIRWNLIIATAVPLADLFKARMEGSGIQ